MNVLFWDICGHPPSSLVSSHKEPDRKLFFFLPVYACWPVSPTPTLLGSTEGWVSCVRPLCTGTCCQTSTWKARLDIFLCSACNFLLHWANVSLEWILGYWLDIHSGDRTLIFPLSGGGLLKLLLAACCGFSCHCSFGSCSIRIIWSCCRWSFRSFCSVRVSSLVRKSKQWLFYKTEEY